MDEHAERVRQVSITVKHFYQKKQKFRMTHGSTNSTRSQFSKERRHVVDTSMFNHVLSIDTQKGIAIVEPNVPLDRLVEATLACDLIPPVVMDFPGITAGGGYAGTACESSSFKYGFFNHTVRQIEMVLGNGDVVTCSNDERADLFNGSAAALGSLGVLTLLEIQLVQATKYVEVTYHPVSSFEEAVARCQTYSDPSSTWDFLDAIMFSPTLGAVITGRYTNDKKQDLAVQRFSAPTDPWYAWHVKSKIERSEGVPYTELQPLPEYLFRYDRGAFWVGDSIFTQSGGLLPFNRTTRKILDPFMHTRMLYAAMHSAAGAVSTQMVQDLIVPYSKATEFLDWCTQKLEIWPLWLCPIKQKSMPTLHPHSTVDNSANGDLAPILNIGIWGTAPSACEFDTFFAMNSLLEDKLLEVGGMKWMYGINLQNSEDFWSQHDKVWYDALRKKYHADWMPSIADKATTTKEKIFESANSVSRREVWPLRYFPGVLVTCLWRAWRTGEWKWKKESTWMEWVPREEQMAALAGERK